MQPTERERLITGVQLRQGGSVEDVTSDAERHLRRLRDRRPFEPLIEHVGQDAGGERVADPLMDLVTARALSEQHLSVSSPMAPEVLLERRLEIVAEWQMAQ